jgi:hypothetical protein
LAIWTRAPVSWAISRLSANNDLPILALMIARCLGSVEREGDQGEHSWHDQKLQHVPERLARLDVLAVRDPPASFADARPIGTTHTPHEPTVFRRVQPI